MEVYKGKNKNKNPKIHKKIMLNQYYKNKINNLMQKKNPIIKIIYEPTIINFN
jgi:hypothetical protein